MSTALVHDLALIGRAAAAAAACGLVGAERQARGHEAGLRTYGLVGLGAASLMTLATDAFAATGDRALQGIITGIGFLGAGMLVRDGHHVRNLTSASASWASAAVGAIFGVGRFVLGAGVTALILVLLELPYLPLLRYLDPDVPLRERWRGAGGRRVDHEERTGDGGEPGDGGPP